MSSTERFSRPQAKGNPDFSLIGFPSPKVKKVKTIGREIGELLRDFLVVCNKFREAERQKQEAAVKYAESIGVYEWMSPELKAQMIMLAAIRETFSPKPSASNGVLKFPLTKQEALLQKIESVVESKPFGKATFKAIGDVLTQERKAHIKQDIAPDIAPLKKRKLKAGNLARPETIKGYEMLQKLLADDDKPEWDEIARECLTQPGEKAGTELWPKRVKRFRKTVSALQSRLKKETRPRGK
jgi:hypothetical protein